MYQQVHTGRRTCRVETKIVGKGRRWDLSCVDLALHVCYPAQTQTCKKMQLKIFCRRTCSKHTGNPVEGVYRHDVPNLLEENTFQFQYSASSNEGRQLLQIEEASFHGSFIVDEFLIFCGWKVLLDCLLLSALSLNSVLRTSLKDVYATFERKRIQGLATCKGHSWSPMRHRVTWSWHFHTPKFANFIALHGPFWMALNGSPQKPTC